MPDREKPNVLLICTDHWPGPLVRPAGHPVIMTPTVAQLAQNGVWFENAYSACASCIPARRSLMTGLSARGHGDRTFKETEPMPDVPTLAQCFRDGGYQAFAVGKLHVYPQRNRIGFDDVILLEEGRHHLEDRSDDWEIFLAEQGFSGHEFAGGQCSNDYIVRCWHLPDHCHPTNWATREMCRAIYRRDPRKPMFLYLSYIGPHPPNWPLQAYMDVYRDVTIDPPVIGKWTEDERTMPHMLRTYSDGGSAMRDAPQHEIDLARRAFYATITHIDHQIRVVIGTLREQGLLNNTVIALTSDHGDMLGDHRLWAKTVMYEMSARVPLVIVPSVGDKRLTPGGRDRRLVELRDLMPTLLELAGLPVPKTVEGMSLLHPEQRSYLYGEHWEDHRATRMLRDDRHKLIYYAAGNRFQLFDLHDDPREQLDVSESEKLASVRQSLTVELVKHLYGSDLEWLHQGKLVGIPETDVPRTTHRDLAGQRGIRFG